MKTAVLESANPNSWRDHLFGLPKSRWTDLKGLAFWVTGAGTGYGRCIAFGLAAAGATVFMTGRRKSMLESAIESFTEFGVDGNDCHLLPADVTSEADISNACLRIESSVSALSGIVHCAGLAGLPRGEPFPLMNGSLDDWRDMLDVNARGPWLLTRTIMPHMIRGGLAKALLLTSAAGWAGTSGFGLYNVSKAALNGLGHSMAMEFQDLYPDADVQINVLDPGEAKTEMNRGSDVSPFSIVSMALALLSHPPGGPNGRFFHRDGRHLAFGLTKQYPLSLLPNRSTNGKQEKAFMHDRNDRPDDSASNRERLMNRLRRSDTLKKLMATARRNNTARKIYHLLRRSGSVGNQLEKLNDISRCLYPIPIPELHVEPDLDFLLLELPPRYQPVMPNGLGYVHAILDSAGVRHQTIDVSIIMYHRYHSDRLLNGRERIVTSDGFELKEDPWDNTNVGDWVMDEVLDHFWPQLQDLIEKIKSSPPKAIGISLNGNNRTLARRFIKAIRQILPELIVVVGGYDCVYYEVARYLVKDYDYMFIGEAEETLPGLAKALAAGERPKDLPGIVSRFDSPDREWKAGPLPLDPDAHGYPKYEWLDHTYYQTFDLKHLIPILVSRGCNWGRCRFCAECLPYRARDPRKVVDEIEYWNKKGLHTFHFNDSDVNGNPDKLYDVCTEIIKRGLKLQLIGQLRIHKKNTAEYFRHLAKAGFKHLRFGVDGWNDHTLQLQRKGYNTKMVLQNLEDCHAAGIYTTVNVVLGVPGETDEDVDEIIANLIRTKDWVNSVESLNTLILAAGSEYFKNPDQYKIRFRGDINEIVLAHPYFIPTDLWYSEEPYIDQDVRLQRLTKIITTLEDSGVTIGAFASNQVKKLKEKYGEASG